MCSYTGNKKLEGMTPSRRISCGEYSEFRQECLSCTRIVVGMDKTYHVTFSSWRIYPEGSQAHARTCCSLKSRLYGRV